MRDRKEKEIPMEEFYSLRVGAYWRQMKREHFSFWMVCGYLIVEYVRPQSIIPSLDFLPWAQLFVLAAILGVFVDPQRHLVRDSANVWMTAFLLTAVASSALAIYPGISWQYTRDLATWYVIYLLIIHTVNTEKRFLIFLALFLLASFKLSAFGARTWAMRGFTFTSWGLMGPPGYFQNSGEFALQMLMFAPIAFECARFLRPWLSTWKYSLLLLLPVTAAMSVLGASSRGSQLGLVYQIYRCLLKGRFNFRAILITACVIVGTLALLPDEQKERFAAVGEDRTSRQRLLYWTHGLEMIREHPVLGVGYFNFPRYYEVHYPQDMLYERAELPHNIFIQVGTDTGLIGLFFYSMLLVRNVRAARQIQELAKHADKPTLIPAAARGLSVAIWGFIIAGQFVSVAYYPFIWINLAMTIALLNIACREYGRVPSTPARLRAKPTGT